MADYIMHTPESAPEAVRHILAGAQQKLGFVPNLYAGMANAPATLQAYLALSGFVEQTSLSPTDRHVIYLTASEVNGCEFCVAAHSMLAKKWLAYQKMLSSHCARVVCHPIPDWQRWLPLRGRLSRNAAGSPTIRHLTNF